MTSSARVSLDAENGGFLSSVPPRGPLPRPHLAALFAVFLIWQVYVVFAAFHRGAGLEAILTGLGATPPLVTRAYLRTLRLWPLVPVLSLLLAADVVRRPAPGFKYSALALFLVGVSGFVLQAWATEAWFVPMLELMRKVG